MAAAATQTAPSFPQSHHEPKTTAASSKTGKSTRSMTPEARDEYLQKQLLGVWNTLIKNATDPNSSAYLSKLFRASYDDTFGTDDGFTKTLPPIGAIDRKALQTTDTYKSAQTLAKAVKRYGADIRRWDETTGGAIKKKAMECLQSDFPVKSEDTAKSAVVGHSTEGFKSTSTIATPGMTVVTKAPIPAYTLPERTVVTLPGDSVVTVQDGNLAKRNATAETAISEKVGNENK